MEQFISVIIINYNGLKYLENCLNSLYIHLEGLNFEIIVVDNCSSDNSVNFIKENFTDVIVIQNPDNLGFGKANNIGVSFAKGETILLLNNDTIILDDIKHAVEVLYSQKNNGIVSINMLNKHREYITAVGRFPSPFKLLKISFLNDKRKEFKNASFNLTENYTVDWVTGSFMLLRKNDYLELKGFDNDYFMYVEDVDFCKRMHDFGKSCVFIPSINYIHFVGHNKSRNKNLMKGYQIYASKHFSGFKREFALLMITINILVKRITNNI